MTQILFSGRRFALHFFVAMLGVGAAGHVSSQPVLSVVPGEQMRMDLAGSSVATGADGWDIQLRMENDNGEPNGVLPAGFRRWWHVQIDNLDDITGERLNISVTNSEYSDNITPVWSLDGGTTYTRIPPAMDLGTFTFRIDTPPGVSSIRLAKYYPYTLSHFAAYRLSVTGSPSVAETQIGTTGEGRPIYLWEITDPAEPNAGKKRVWIHCAVHPSENTAHFMMEGLVDWLVSGDPEAEIFLDNVILDIVPMANPDGVANGNYRVNASSVNLEVQWGAPYNSTVPEIVAMRTKIEEFMGTSGSPGANPILLLLNLHSTHGSNTPYHFVHQPSYYNNGTGVIPEVNTLEVQWVNFFKARNAYVASGTSGSSTLSGRAYAEAMMHDRYTLNPTWDPIMAITFEGVYEGGPIPGTPNTDDDYRQVGRDMGYAIADFFAIDLTAQTSTDVWLLF